MFVDKRRDFLVICKKYGLGYEKDKVESLYSQEMVWVNYVTKYTPEQEQVLKENGLELRCKPGSFYPYIWRRSR